MNVWIIQTGEPLPIRSGVRKMRSDFGPRSSTRKFICMIIGQSLRQETDWRSILIYIIEKGLMHP